MNYCEDCGCKMYNGFCTNCHEEVFIEEQYIGLDEEIPNEIHEKSNEHRKFVSMRNSLRIKAQTLKCGAGKTLNR